MMCVVCAVLYMMRCLCCFVCYMVRVLSCIWRMMRCMSYHACHMLFGVCGVGCFDVRRVVCCVMCVV